MSGLRCHRHGDVGELDEEVVLQVIDLIRTAPEG
jgi:hypothetical protein